MAKDKRSGPSPRSLRPPVVTIMGHVDHGKTTLLDFIRRSSVAAHESGGITQHICAYTIEFKGRQLTFIDTPGHEAFSAMRSRGGKVADLVILVVDATEGVKPQTVEVLDLVVKSGMPVVVAINKTDLPNADPASVKGELGKHGLLIEELGGNVVCLEVSAKTGKNVDQLLEIVLLTFDLSSTPAGEEGSFGGYVLESRLDRHKGTVATVVVKSGSLRLGMEFRAGAVIGKVRQLTNDRGQSVSEITSGKVGEVTGFSSLPEVGERVVSRLDSSSLDDRKEPTLPSPKFPEAGVDVFLRILLKADVTGSLEVLHDLIQKFSSPETPIRIIQAGVGDVNDSDVNFAKASQSVIFAFRVRTSPTTRMLADSLGVEVRDYDVVYKVAENLESVGKGIKIWTKKEGKGEAQVSKIFPLASGDLVLGCHIERGSLKVGDLLKIRRDDAVIGKTRVKSLQRGKTKVDRVSSDQECGVLLSDSIVVQAGDILEVE